MLMKSILLIGLGKFGTTLGEKLRAMGDDVMIVDKNEEAVNALSSEYTNALIANCANVNNLKSLDVPSYDCCIVAIGDDFQSSLEITSLLKDLGAKYIVSKAATSIQKKFLLRCGADEVVYPDEDIAEKLAVKLNSRKVFDYIEIDSDHAILEIAVPSKWIGKTVVDVDSRKKFGLNILIVKNSQKEPLLPSAEYAFAEGDHILVFGETAKVLEFTNGKHR